MKARNKHKNNAYLRAFFIFSEISYKMRSDNIFLHFFIYSILFFSSIKIESKNHTTSIKTNNSSLLNFTTPSGSKIKFTIKKEKYFLQWKNQKRYQTLNYPFELNGAESHKPKFIAESKDYILMRASCGNPCWIGAFLPKKSKNKPIIINEYFAYDLDKSYVCYLNSTTENLEILNLQTSTIQTIKTEYCSSAFKGYCIDTIYFSGKKLYYKWNCKNDSTSKNNELKEINIKI